MKQLVYFLAVVVLFFVSCVGSSKKELSEWELKWSDEFNGTSLDETVWSRIGRGGSDWNRHMSTHESLCEVKDGKVILKGVANTFVSDDTAKFITGGIFTKDKKSFGYGRIEISAKYSLGQGFWPALWLLPSSPLGWPNGGEIDIMEHLNYEDIVYQTVHTPYTLSKGYVNNPPKGVTAPINKEIYNVYAVERYPDSICFFVNDNKVGTYPRIDSLSDKGQFPFNQSDFYLLMDSQLGGSWVGGVDMEDLPVEMSIDWVKYYEKRTK